MTTLPANIQKFDNEELMAFVGQNTGPRFDTLPRLTINDEPIDEQNHPLPVGSFCLTQSGVGVYGVPVTFRPFINAYQFMVWDNDAKNYSNRSVVFKNFKEEAPDELGGVACGKVVGKKKANLTPEQLERQKPIKTYRLLYGLVSFTGRAADGSEVNVENVPSRLRISGSSFMEPNEVLDVLSSKRIPMLLAPLTLTTVRKKEGASKWWAPVFALNLDNLVTLQDSDWENLKLFQEAINRDNRAILDKHKNSRKSSGADEREAVIMLDADLNDNIDDVS